MFITTIIISLFLIVVSMTVRIVQQQEVYIVEQLGKFSRILQPGINFIIPIIEGVRGKMSLRIKQLDVAVETKTKDNVFVKIKVSIQYNVIPEKVYEAFYKLVDSHSQISSYVFDVVRSEVPKLNLDDVFQNKEDIAKAVKAQLVEQMDDFGYGIINTLITDIDPDEKVKVSMNAINAAERMKQATMQTAEAEKIKVVKAAEAEAESKKLAGQGIADQRKAIVDGLKTSVQEFQEGVGGTAESVMNLVLAYQYMDTLEKVSNTGQNKVLLLPYGAGGANEISKQIMEGIILGSESIKPVEENKKK